eukprot:jgi/Chlat1/8563/Chrsp82S07983
MAPAIVADTLLSCILWPATLLYLIPLAPVLYVWRWLTHSTFVAALFGINPRNRVALVTGASSGIGKELAKEFARRGAKVFMCARRERMLQDLAREASRLGSPDVAIRVTDVKREDECKAMVMECVERFGRLDFLCLNAGAAHSFLFEEADSTEGFKDTLDVDFWGAVYPTHYALDPLKRTRGQILVTASVAGFIPFPRQSLYNASKAALINFFDTVRVELSGVVGVTIACPGWVKTEITDGKILDAQGRTEESRERAKEHIGPIPMAEAPDCAVRMVNAALARKRYVVFPSWYGTLLLQRLLAPEIQDFFFRTFYVPTNRRSHAPAKQGPKYQ